MQKQGICYKDSINKLRNQVVLIDRDDNQLDVMDKMEAHRQGLLHRAFSIFVINEKNELLLQRRALSKYHGGGLWTNTCCSHPQPNESILDAGKDRLDFEMGLRLELEYGFRFLYKGDVENDLIEHELDHVLFAFSAINPVINPDEVMDYQWVALQDLSVKVEAEPTKFTIWFQKCLPMVITYLQNRI